MRMMLEVFYVKPPTYHRETLFRKESTDLKELVALGESRQSDTESIYYHILFEGMPAGREEENGAREQAAI